MKFKKCDYEIRVRDELVPVEGYSFELSGHKLYMRKRAGAKYWEVTDPRTGLQVPKVFGKTREATVDSMSEFMERYEQIIGYPKYQDGVRQFEELRAKHSSIDRKQVMKNVALKEKYGDKVHIEMTDAAGRIYEVTASGLVDTGQMKEEIMDKEKEAVKSEEFEFRKHVLGNFGAAYERLYEADYIPAELVDAGDRWMKAEHDELMKLTAQRGDMFTSDREVAALALAVRWSYGNGSIRIENYDSIVGWEANGDAVILKPKAEEVRTATAVTVETLRELVAGHNVVVTQKNERSCIWVMGDTKPLKDELKDAGLRWAPKKQAWWYKPQAA